MKDRQDITCDLVIIGAGFAGMVAAARASSLGLQTVQVGSSSNLFLISGLLDLLGVYPIASGHALKTHTKGLERLGADMPEHPYSKITYQTIMDSFNFLKSFLKSAGLSYRSDRNENCFALTAAGTFKPSFMVPETFSKGCTIQQEAKRLLFIDFKGLREFSAKQLVSVTHDTCLETAALTIDIPGLAGSLNPNQLANLFEDTQFVKHLAEKILPFSQQTDLVGLPAVCGLSNSLETIRMLEKLTGLGCFEIPGLPPSIPGLRLKNAFEKQLSQQNVIFLSNSKITAHAVEGHQFVLTATNQNMNIQIKAKGVILATGRFFGGGLHAGREGVCETLFGLPVYQPEQRSQWHHLNFFNLKGHSINTAGLETDGVFRPLDRNIRPAFDTLYAVGSILAHNDWIRLKSGSGVSCVTAYTAVNHFYDKVFGGADA